MFCFLKWAQMKALRYVCVRSSCWRWCRSWRVSAWLFWCWGGNTCCGPPDPGTNRTWVLSSRRPTAFLLITCENHIIWKGILGNQPHRIHKTQISHLLWRDLTPACLSVSVLRTTLFCCMPLCILGTTVSLWAGTWWETTKPASQTGPRGASSSSGKGVISWWWMGTS